MLAHAADIDSAIDAVRKFFDETLLLQYDSVICQREYSYSATDPQFWQKIDEGIEKNKAVLNGFVEELENDDFRIVSDLKSLSQGYQSKLLHIIAHFLDGFIGVDTVFYNLTEDSHWLTEQAKQTISENPGHFWLIQVSTSFEDRKFTSLI